MSQKNLDDIDRNIVALVDELLRRCQKLFTHSSAAVARSLKRSDDRLIAPPLPRSPPTTELLLLRERILLPVQQVLQGFT
jgi:hypothetical protein